MSGSLTGSQSGGQTISFNTIPLTILRPQTIIEVVPDYTNSGLVGFPVRNLLIGQMTNGTAAPGVPVRITRPGQAEILFGAPCPLTDMVNSFLLANRSQPLWAVGAVAPVGSVAATSTVTFTQAAIGAGTLPFIVNDRNAPTIVASGATAAQQAAAFAAVVNADPLMPVTAVAAAGVVTLTCRFAGALGNNVRVRFAGGDTVANAYVPGVVVQIADPTNGAGLPDISPILATAASTWYTGVALGWGDAVTLGEVNTEAERRFAADGRLDARFYNSVYATIGQALASTAGIGGRFLYTLPIVSTTPPWSVAASLCAVCEFNLTNDPARQLKTLPLPGVRAPIHAYQPLADDQEALLGNGWTTFDTLSDGSIVLQRVVSRYLTNAESIPDPAWRDVMSAAVATRIRYDFGSYLGLVWPNAKLADDDSVAAQFDPKVATPRRLWNSWAARCQLYAQLGWIENLTVLLPQAKIVRDPNDRNRVNARLPYQALGNEMVFAAQLQPEV